MFNDINELAPKDVAATKILLVKLNTLIANQNVLISLVDPKAIKEYEDGLAKEAKDAAEAAKKLAASKKKADEAAAVKGAKKQKELEEKAVKDSATKDKALKGSMKPGEIITQSPNVANPNPDLKAGATNIVAHQLAKDLKVEFKDLVAKAKELKIEIKAAQTRVSVEDAKKIEEAIGGETGE